MSVLSCHSPLTCSGNFERFVLAKSSSSFSDMVSYISRDAPLSFDLGMTPRLAARAAPAAFCWAWDFAGMGNSFCLSQLTQTKRGKNVRSSRFREQQKEQISCPRIRTSELNPERKKIMDTYRDQKIRPTVTSQTDGNDDLYVRPDVNLNQSNQSSNGIVGIVIAALVLIAAGYFLFSGGPSTQTTAPVATQNSAPAPAPAPSAAEKVAPVPAVPSAADSTTAPAAMAPATTAPATTAPATGTSTNPPAAPAQ
jgi:hypothetical protein